MRIRHLGVALFLIFGVTSVHCLAADSGFNDVAIDRFSAEQTGIPDFDAVIKGLSEMFTSDLSVIADDMTNGPDARFKSCKIRLLEWTRRAEVLDEIKLRNSKFGDPSTRVDPKELINPNLLIKSHVSLDGATVKWTMSITNHPSGKVQTTISGEIPRDEMLAEMTREMSRQLVEKLCKPEGFEVTARFNDLSLSGTICDSAKPFTLKGKGKTSGIVFTFTPSSEEAGSFAVGGTAGGVPWTGGGNYELHQKEGVGTLTMTGKWSIKTPVGVFPGAGTIPGKLSPASGKCKLQ